MRNMLLVLPMFLLSVLAAGAADGFVPNRLAQAKVGEWTLMRNVAGEHAGELTRFIVVERKGSGADAAVVLRRERLDERGEVSDERQFDINLDKLAERMAGIEEKAKQVSRERMTVKDKDMVVYAITWDHESKRDGKTYEMKMWVSEEVPVGGMVKNWSENPRFPSSELVDYGVMDVAN